MPGILDDEHCEIAPIRALHSVSKGLKEVTPRRLSRLAANRIGLAAAATTIVITP